MTIVERVMERKLRRQHGVNWKLTTDRFKTSKRCIAIAVDRNVASHPR